MDDIKDRERIAKQIAKTSESIRRKYRALKTGEINENIALERHFKPVVEPLKQIVEHTEKSQPIKIEADVAKDIKKKTNVTKNISIEKKRENGDNEDDNDDTYWMDDGWLQLTPPPKKQRTQQLSATRAVSPTPNSTPIDPPKEPPTIPSLHRKETVFETEDVSESPPLKTPIRHALRTQQVREMLYSQLGPLGRKYVGMLFGNDVERALDTVYGVYFDKDGTMLGDKKFDIDKDDYIIIDNVRYIGTPGLCELIFKRLPDEAVFTEDDKQKYKSILMATNAYRRGYKADNAIMGNRGYKYTNIIGPLVSAYKSRKGAGVSGVPSTMRLTGNEIDYVHWDDPNELVDRLRLLDASRRAGNNAHDNEMLSIIEELREAGIIIN